MRDLFWEYTQGIAHIAVSLFYLCQARAVMAGREVIDKVLVTKVFNEELSMIHPMINALRSGREDKILQYADLDISRDSIRIFGQQVPETGPDTLSANDAGVGDRKETKQSKLAKMLVQMGLGEDIAPLVAEQTIAEKPEEDLFGLVAHIRNLQERKAPLGKPVKPKAEPLCPVYLDNDLRQLRDDDPLLSYQNLKQVGIIIELAAYL
ncbi:hypothetical protein [Aeromonas sp. 1HA1]|nr:hypothetical protein [Aeromonas sp. 1HA1]